VTGITKAMIDLSLKADIFSVEDEYSFQINALKIYKYQVRHNPVYRQYHSFLGVNPESVTELHGIPFLPIEVYKEQRVIVDGADPALVFRSSNTTGSSPSSHLVAEPSLYIKSILRGFEYFFGSPTDYVFLALLPSYIERNDASLIYMMDQLMKASGHPLNGFYLHHEGALLDAIRTLKQSGQKFILWGVSFALLDLANEMEINLTGNIVVETGGMKGRDKEWIKEELHDFLKTRFHLPAIHSEYGMTELLSQAYSLDGNMYRSVPWMKVMIRDMYDPWAGVLPGQTGCINVIDLANIYSCSFIATQDVGRMHTAGLIIATCVAAA